MQWIWIFAPLLDLKQKVLPALPSRKRQVGSGIGQRVLIILTLEHVRLL